MNDFRTLRDTPEVRLVLWLGVLGPALWRPRRLPGGPGGRPPPNPTSSSGGGPIYWAYLLIHTPAVVGFEPAS
ncbi:hypothetical protein INR49_002720 [Caranx melampygus]|nr:hypothetical protein INR49_002720 [Caranx melampygus]